MATKAHKWAAIAALFFAAAAAGQNRNIDGQFGVGYGYVQGNHAANIHFSVTKHFAEGSERGYLPSFRQPWKSNIFLQAGFSGMSTKYSPGGEVYLSAGIQSDNQHLALAATFRHRFVQHVETQNMRTIGVMGAVLQYRAGHFRLYAEATPKWYSIGIAGGIRWY